MCFPIIASCNYHAHTSTLFNRPSPFNNCKAINANGSRGHSSFSGSESVTTCGAHSAFHSQLGGGNQRCMGVECRKRVRARALINTVPMPPTKRANLWGGGNGDNKHGDREDEAERSDLLSRQRPRRVLLPPIHSPKERWWPQANNKPKEIESVCETTTLQNGEHQHVKRYPQTGRLHDKGRPERCVLHGPATGKTPQPNKVHLEGLNFPVQLPSLRVVVGPLGLYQDHKANHDCPEVHGSQDSHVHRRHTHFSRVRDSGQGTYGSTGFSLRESRDGNKPPKIADNPNPNHRIPGIYHRLYDNGTETARREDQKNQGRGETADITAKDQRTGPVTSPWQTEPRDPGDTAGTSVLPIPTGVLERGVGQREPRIPA